MAVMITALYWLVNDNFTIGTNCSALTTDNIKLRCVATQFDSSQFGQQFKAGMEIQLPNGNYKSKVTALETVNSIVHDFTLPLEIIIGGSPTAGTYSTYIAYVYDANNNVVAQSSSGGGLCSVLSVVAPNLGSITISPSIGSISPGSAIQLGSTCYDTSNNSMSCPTLTWLSDDTSVATVSPTGLVTGISEGTANITASVSNIVSNKAMIGVGTPICPCPPDPGWVYWICRLTTVGKTIFFTTTFGNDAGTAYLLDSNGATLQTLSVYGNNVYTFIVTNYGIYTVKVCGGWSGAPCGQCTVNISEPLGKMHFIVKDSVTNDPIDGVLVYIDDVLQSTTSSTGELIISNLSTGISHSYKLSKIGYVNKTKSSISLSPGETLNENVSLVPTAGAQAPGAGGAMALVGIVALGLAYFYLKGKG